MQVELKSTDSIFYRTRIMVSKILKELSNFKHSMLVFIIENLFIYHFKASEKPYNFNFMNFLPMRTKKKFYLTLNNIKYTIFIF